jgi:hypothetical protein
VALKHFIFLPLFNVGVAPFPGATTGTGGRIRDVQATGRGAHVVAGKTIYFIYIVTVCFMCWKLTTCHKSSTTSLNLS